MDKPSTQEMYQIATTMKQEGRDDYDIEQALLMKGLNQDEARKIISRASATTTEITDPNAQKGNGAYGWLIWIGLLGLVNLLSYLFDWSFWIY